MAGFDIIGSIAIIEASSAASARKTANQILKQHSNIMTVMKKKGGHTGKYRIQKLMHVAGEKNTVVIHRENNAQIKLDIAKVYFSPRMAAERLRIARQVKKGEDVLVMFSGCGPYTCVIAKNSKPKRIVAIEANPEAHKYAIENLKLNKITNAVAIKGNARNIDRLGKFDRIIMPLPKGASAFLPAAIKAAKKNAAIHYYDFIVEKEIPETGLVKIRKAFAGSSRKHKIIRHVKCGQLAPRAYRVCFDIRII